MALSTFAEIRGSILLRIPGVPVPLAEQAINNAYRRCLDLFRWAGQRAESEFTLAAPYTTGTVTVTQGDTAITGSGTTWTSAMTGRQFLVGGQAPYYTFTFVNATSGTLDRAYGGDTASGASYSIQPLYLTPASDFERFISIRDIERDTTLDFYATPELLDLADPQRTSEGDPTNLVAATFSAAPPRWEIWPRPSAALNLSYRYQKRLSDLSGSSLPIFPIRGNLLLEGALAELSLWPGTRENPNLYFRPDLNEQHEKRFMDLLTLAQREDQEIAQTDITVADGGTPRLSSTWAQEHAVPA